ncbi:MAG: PCMD domain-containing protein [Bacteroides sp.]|nr:PCMD domain-containing protein [Bacteroides sp.]
MNIFLVGLLMSVLLFIPCINNDIPYPTIPVRILSFEMEGRIGSTTIDNNTRTVTVEVADTTYLKRVMVKQCTVTEGAEAPLDSAAIIDLSSPISYTLSLYQDYQWTIQAVQNIERTFSVNKQIGKSIFNTTLHQVVAYISSKASQREVQIKELKLGPTGITHMEPALEGIINFSLPKKVTVSYHDVVEEWTVMVSKSDKDVATGTADAWVNVAWLHGSGEEGGDNGFEYKEINATDWIRVEKDDITEKKGELTGRINRLKAMTTYVFRTYSGEDYGDEVTFTTTSAVELPGGTFDDWHLEKPKNKVWNPWAESGTPTWDTGNDGATTMGDSNTQPTDDVWPGKGTGFAARLESKFIGIASIGKFAAGNLFIGEYVRTDGTDGELSFGKPFSSYPTKLKGHYKYITAPINQLSKNTDDYNRFLPLKGLPDTCSIYIALGDWSEPITIKTKPSVRQLFDKNDPHIIAYAEFNSGTSVSEYTDLELTLNYRATNRKPTYIIMVCSASKYGDYYTGGEGAVLCVDEFSLEYDY